MPRDREALRASLRAYLPWGHEITAIRQMTWGLSNGTYLLEGANRVLRMPPEEDGLLPPYNMAWQHDVYRRVAAAPGGPPVPPMFELCEDETVAGVPFYVMERLNGESFDRHALPAWLTTDPAAADALSANWIATMASVHTMPTDTLAGPLRTSASEATEWLERGRALNAPPLVLSLLQRFAAEPPPDTGPPASVHGDPNLTNLLWDGPRVVALLDWELSGIGEPFADIAFLLAFCRDEGEPESWGLDAPGWWPKPKMVRRWESLTGRTVQKWRHHEMLAMCRLATILCIGSGLVEEGRKTDPRIADMGERLARYLVRMERRLTRIDIDD